MNKKYHLRTMTVYDYEQSQALWMTIHGFAIRSIDDSKESIEHFIWRNPTTSIVAEIDGRIVGTILCGHDGRNGCFYLVCVLEEYRGHGIGGDMMNTCMDALRAEHINKVSLVAFADNEIGNQFWHQEGWRLRSEVNCYEFNLNEENRISINE